MKRLNDKDQIKLISIFKNTFLINDEDVIRNLTMDNFVKWDSLAAVSIIAVISDKFSIDINPEDFDKFTSYKSIEKYILDKKY